MKGPHPGAGAAVVAGGGLQGGRQRPLCPGGGNASLLVSCLSVLNMPSRSFPRKSSMSEAGAGMSAQSPTRGWPAAAAALGHIACFFFMTEVHACCAGLCWSRRCSSLSSHARVCQSPPRHALSQVLHAPRCGTGGPVYPRVYAALRLPAPSPQALPLHSPPLGNPKSALCL